jgi:hypothetical protein
VRLFLTPHPLSRSLAVDQIEVEIERPRTDQLTLSFTLTGNIPRISVPHISAPVRRRELWKRTCFEAFLRAFKESQYYEFNFSPSTEWAAYKFDDYRTKMREAPEIDAIQIDWWSEANSYTLQARLKIGSMPDVARATWQIGLSAIIEECSGSRSYWSLVHPTEKPDFHHPASFTHELIPREQT